jgi:hypothetical protein
MGPGKAAPARGFEPGDLPSNRIRSQAGCLASGERPASQPFVAANEPLKVRRLVVTHPAQGL